MGWADTLRKSAEYARRAIEDLASALKQPQQNGRPSLEPAYSRYRNRRQPVVGPPQQRRGFSTTCAENILAYEFSNLHLRRVKQLACLESLWKDRSQSGSARMELYKLYGNTSGFSSSACASASAQAHEQRFLLLPAAAGASPHQQFPFGQFPFGRFPLGRFSFGLGLSGSNCIFLRIKQLYRRLQDWHTEFHRQNDPIVEQQVINFVRAAKRRCQRGRETAWEVWQQRWIDNWHSQWHRSDHHHHHHGTAGNGGKGGGGGGHWKRCRFGRGPFNLLSRYLLVVVWIKSAAVRTKRSLKHTRISHVISFTSTWRDKLPALVVASRPVCLGSTSTNSTNSLSTGTGTTSGTSLGSCISMETRMNCPYTRRSFEPAVEQRQYSSIKFPAVTHRGRAPSVSEELIVASRPRWRGVPEVSAPPPPLQSHDEFSSDNLSDTGRCSVNGAATATAAAVDFVIQPQPGVPNISDLSQDSLDQLRTALSTQIANLQSVLADIGRIAELGELPVSLERHGSVLRVHFPNADAERVATLAEDKEIMTGEIVEMEPSVSDDGEEFVHLASSEEPLEESLDEIWSMLYLRPPELTEGVTSYSEDCTPPSLITL